MSNVDELVERITHLWDEADRYRSKERLHSLMLKVSRSQAEVREQEAEHLLKKLKQLED